MSTHKPSFLRRWFRFRLRTLLLVTAVIAVCISWVQPVVQRARRQRAAVEVILRNGGEVEFVGGVVSRRGFADGADAITWWEWTEHELGLPTWFGECRSVTLPSFMRGGGNLTLRRKRSRFCGNCRTPKGCILRVPCLARICSKRGSGSPA